MKNVYSLLILSLLLIVTQSSSIAQTAGMPGFINGDKVNMRSDHSTQARPVTMLNKGQRINIITSYQPEGNYNEAILRKTTDFYSEDYGYKLFTLHQGKAVLVKDRVGDMYNVSFKNESTGNIGYAKIQSHLLEFIGGDTWYFVEANGQKGWVFGKYVTYY
jgi:hypothetical protein